MSAPRVHGHCLRAGRSPEFRSWESMRRRCNSPRERTYQRYGGRGIKVCERWQTSFENFLADMGPRPPGTSIDRIDPNGNYEPSNCRWADAKQQALNRRNNRMITAFGVTRCITHWQREYGLDATTIKARLAKGMTPEQALSTPPRRPRGTP